MSSPSDFAVAAQALAASVMAAAIDPADALRMLSVLADFTAPPSTSAAPVGKAIAAMQDAAADLFRRAAIVALARASAAYQPSSYDDAAAVRTIVSTLLEAEIEIAGDQGEDATFKALRALRTAVVQDLTARGANLAVIATLNTGDAMPAPALAQRLYRDPDRADELIAESGSPHPAFLATSFRVLSR